MNNFITTAEVFEIAVNRTVSTGLIKPTQIIAAEEVWFEDILDDDFAALIRENKDGVYDDLIEDYIKPVIAWGTIYNNFDYISMNITDKGIIQMLVEGTANLVGRDSRIDARNEIKHTVHILVNRLFKYCEKKKSDNDVNYELFDYKYQPSAIVFYGSDRQNLRPI
ncbi:MAG: hypothetical protein ACOC2U_01090 [bacterium]